MFLQRLFFANDSLFILSGALITFIFLQDGKSIGPVRFYLSRSLRIFPAFYCGIFGLYLLRFSDQTQLNWRELVFLGNYPMTVTSVLPWSWSISVEEHFYIVAPFLLLFLKKYFQAKTQVAVVAGIAIAAFTIEMLYILANPNVPQDIFRQNFNYATHARIDTLASGMALGLVIYHFNDRLLERLNRLSGRPFYAIMLVSFVFMFRPWEHSEQVANFTGNRLYDNFILSIAPIFFVVSWMLASLNSNTVIHRVMCLSVFKNVAPLAYGFCIVHPLVLLNTIYFTRNLIREPLLFALINFTIAFAISALIAYIFHLLVEKPLLNFRRSNDWLNGRKTTGVVDEHLRSRSA